MPFPSDGPALTGLSVDVNSVGNLLDLSSAGAVLVDASLRVLHVNGALAHLVGAELHAARGQPLAGLLPGVPREVLDACQVALQGGPPQRELQFDLITPEGPSPVRGALAPLHGVHQQVVGLVLTFEEPVPPAMTLQAERLRRLQAVTAALTGAVTANDVKTIILQQVVPATAAYAGSLIKAVDDGALYTVGAVGYDPALELTWQRLPAEEGFPGVAVIQSQRPVFATLEDLQREYAAVLPLLQPRTRAVAALPLIADGLVLGSLNLSFTHQEDIGPDRQGHLLALAEVSSQALRRARQYDAEHAAHQRAALLAEAGTSLAESLDVPATLERITALALDSVADWAAVSLPDPGGRLVAVAAAHPDPAKAALLRLFLTHAPEAPGSPARVLQTGQPVLVPVVPPSIVDEWHERELREAFRTVGLHSVIHVPLAVRGRNLGVLTLGTTHPSRTYGEADLELAHVLAARAALALDNAQLHEAAHHSEQRYRSLVDATRQAVWTNSPDGRMLGDQPGWAALTGQARAQYEAYGWSEALHPEDQAPTLSAWHHAVATRTALDIVHRVRGADGTFRHFHARAVPVLNADSSVREWVGVHTDITAQVDAQRALQDLNALLEQRVQERTHALVESERRFRSIFDSQFQLIGLLEPDGTLIEANRTALDFAGVSLEDMVGKPFWAGPWWRYSGEVIQDLRDALRQAASGETVRYEVDILDASGRSATIDFSLKPVFDDQGRVILLIPEGRFISEERRLAAVLQAVVSSAPLILFALDRQGHYLISAGAALAALGRQPNELLGQSAHEIYRQVPQVLEPMKRALAGETVHEMGTLQDVTLESWYQPLRDQRGQVNGMVGVAIDVTDRARAEEEREEARARAEVLAALGDALQVVSSPDEVVRRALDTLGPALGVTALMVVPVGRQHGHPITLWGKVPDVVRTTMDREERSLADTPVLARVVSTRRAVYLEDYTHSPGHVSGLDGLACAIEPVLGPDGEVASAVVAWRASAAEWSEGQRDLLRRGAAALTLALERAEVATNLQAQRDALEAANRELQRSNAELERFAFVASHDLQEPLRTIASFSELINLRYENVLDDRGRQYLSMVTDGTVRLKRLIDDLLVFSRLNAQRDPLRPVPTEGPLREALSRLSAAIEASGAQLTIGASPAVLGDGRELTQLFQNLIGNAVKFRRPDTVPEIRIEAQDEGQVWHFQVRDNGIGIPPEYQEQVFGMFQRLYTRDHYEGTGLGLAIVRKIVVRHGGEVWLESTPGEGTTVHFTLLKAEGAHA